MFHQDKGYTPAEIALIVDLRNREIEWSKIRFKLVQAGFRDRSIDGLKRALYRRRDDILRHPKVPQRDRHHDDAVDCSEARKDRERLQRADENFCKALERERLQTGAVLTAGTDKPRPLAPAGVVRSADGFAW